MFLTFSRYLRLPAILWFLFLLSHGLLSFYAQISLCLPPKRVFVVTSRAHQDKEDNLPISEFLITSANFFLQYKVNFTGPRN